LREQHLLEGAQVATRRLALAAEFVAQFAFQAFDLRPGAVRRRRRASHSSNTSHSRFSASSAGTIQSGMGCRQVSRAAADRRH